MPGYLIAYDVVAAKNRARLVRRLEKLGQRVQKSVFFVEAGQQVLKNLERELQSYLDVTDSLLILPVCAHCKAGAIILAPTPPLAIIS